MVSRSLLLVLLVLACLEFFTLAQNESGPSQCCFNFQSHPIPVKFITGYKRTEHRCAKQGVIFILKKGGEICGDLDVEWVQTHINKIDQRMYKN